MSVPLASVNIWGTRDSSRLTVVIGIVKLIPLIALAVLRLRAKGIAATGSPFIAPGGVAAPLLASGIIV
ncbi:MAG: hypothetical protein WDO68_30690 [Gammaproteobacteria bacterium]